MGSDVMRRKRGLAADCRGAIIASGPGRLAQAFGLGLEHDGASVVGPALGLRAPVAGSEPAVVLTGPRVGITKAADLPYRFYARDDPFVSAWRPGKRRAG